MKATNETETRNTSEALPYVTSMAPQSNACRADRRGPTAIASGERSGPVFEPAAGSRGLLPATAFTAEELLPQVYGELRALARRLLSGERAGHTLQPTALVHEAYLRLADQARLDWRGRTHFFAVGARAMRRILVDHARSRSRAKRGGGWARVTFAESNGRSADAAMDLHQLLALDEALTRLADLDRREAVVVELRFFAGLTVAEISELLGVSHRSIEGDWTHARAWLRRELGSGGLP